MTDDTTAYVAGVAISICCSICNSTGMGLQKRVHLRREHIPPSDRVPVFRERQWLIGLCCMAAASLLSLGNFALLGQSRASAMASLTIITNAIMSKYFLGEQFTIVDAGVTALIGTGIIVAVIFGSAAGGSPRTTLEDILALLNRQVVLYASIFVVILFLCAEAFVHYAEKKGEKRSHAEARLECVLRAFLAGLFSGSTGMLAKSVVVSVEAMFAAKSADDLQRYEFWLLSLSLPVSVVMQLRHLNGGLRRFDAMEIVPIYQASIVTVGVAWGWTYFDEAQYLAPLNIGMFVFGCGISVAGIVLLSMKKRQEAAAAKEQSGGIDGGESASESLLGKERKESGGGATALPTVVVVFGGGNTSSTDPSSAASHAHDAKPPHKPHGYGSVAPHSSHPLVGHTSSHVTARDRRGSSMSITPGASLLEGLEAIAPSMHKIVVGSRSGSNEPER